MRVATQGGIFVSEMLDEFEIQGPNGNYRCIALEPLGPSRCTAFDHLENFPIAFKSFEKGVYAASGGAVIPACL